MILTAHLLFGAAIGSSVKNIFLAIVLAFLSHYFLDLLPHAEYNIENIEKKQWNKTLPQFLKVLLDFSTGMLLILVFSGPPANWEQIIIYLCAFSAIVPDGFSVLDLIFKNEILRIHANLHRKKIHFLKYKKIPMFWRIASQVIIVVASAALLKT